MLEEVLEEVLGEVLEDIIGGGNRGGSKGGAGGGAGHSRPEKRSARRDNHARTAATRGTVSPNATPVHPGERWQSCFCGHCRAKNAGESEAECEAECEAEPREVGQTTFCTFQLLTFSTFNFVTSVLVR